MTPNRSLDEFVPPGDEEAGPADPVDGTPPRDAPASADDGDGPVPPTSTYAWSPEGAPCASCGGTVEARWRDGDALVCAECKAW